MADAKIAALEGTVATLQANLTSLSSTLGSAVNAAVADTTELKGSVDTFYLLYSGALVFFMQARVDRRHAIPTLSSASQSHLPRALTTRPCVCGRRGSACSRRDQSESRTRATSCSRTCSTRALLLSHTHVTSALSHNENTSCEPTHPRNLSWHAQVRRRVHLVGMGLRHRVPHGGWRRQPVHWAARQGPRLRGLGARGRVCERRRLCQLVVPMCATRACTRTNAPLSLTRPPCATTDVFAATGATIVSGAMAERAQLGEA